MLIAVATNGESLAEFETAKTFELYQVENNKHCYVKQVSADMEGIGTLAGFLKTVQADVVIAKSITPAAKAVLDMVRIMPVQSALTSAEAAVVALITGRLQPMTSPETKHSDCPHYGKLGGGHCGRH